MKQLTALITVRVSSSSYRVRKQNPTVFKLAPTLLNIIFSVRSFAQLIISLSVTAYTQYWPRPPSGMNSEEKVHVIIIPGLRAGRSVKEIVKCHNLKRTTVWDVKRCYDTFIAAGGLPEDFSSERKTHSRRSDAMDISIVASLQELVDQDLGRSMRSPSRELFIS